MSVLKLSPTALRIESVFVIIDVESTFDDNAFNTLT